MRWWPPKPLSHRIRWIGRRCEGPLSAATVLLYGARSPRAGSSPTGVAIGWPVANIRHRFGGYLRAARATDIRDALVTHRRHSPTNGRDQIERPRRQLMAKGADGGPVPHPCICAGRRPGVGR